MAAPKQTAEQEDILTRGEHFYEENKKIISIVGGGVLAVVIAIVGITNFYLPSKEKEAQEQMFKAQQYFEKDSFNLALHGDGNYKGFVAIASDYKWTKSGCLSHYYAGVSFLRIGEYDNAIKHLKKYSGSEPVVSAMAIGALGDAYSEKDEMDKAITNYKKAAKTAANEFISPYYLFKAALALKVKGDNAEALKLFNEIKSTYPNSNEGREAEKYIAMVS